MTYPHDHDDLQLDAWLETQSGATPTSLNGTADFPPEALVTVARQYHTALHAAERRAVPNIPARQIWEDVMSNTATIGTIAIPGTAGNGTMPPSNRKPLPVSDDSWSKPGHWLVPTLLFAAVLIGILAVYANLYGPNGDPDPTAAPGLAYGSPEASPSVDKSLLDPVYASECTLEPRTKEELAELQRNPIIGDPPVYGPIVPAAAADAQAIYDASRLWQSCAALSQKESVESERNISTWEGDSIAKNSRTLDEYLHNNSALADYLIPSGRTDYVAYSDQEFPIQEPPIDWESTPQPDSNFSFRHLLLPQDVVEFPDGRLGGPLTDIQPANLDEIKARYPESYPPETFTTVQYAIYAQEDGRWVLDEQFELCLTNCENWLPVAQSLFYGNQSMVTLATPIVLPEAPPAIVGSPEASPTVDEWLVDPNGIACATLTVTSAVDYSNAPTNLPMPVENYIPFSQAVSEANQRTIAERFLMLNRGCPATADNPTMSSDFSWMPGPSVVPATADQIESARKISAALPSQDYRDYYIIRPADDTSSNDGNATLLPEDVVQLPDGRLGAPLRIVIESNTPETAITEFTQGYEMAPSVFVVFEQVDGQWLYDELFQLCIGDCDYYWAVIAGELPIPATCDIEPRTLDEISRIQQTETSAAPRQYGPTSPVDLATGEAISAANDLYQACAADGDWRSMASERLIHDARESGSPSLASISGDQRLGTDGLPADAIVFQQELASVLLPGTIADYIVETDDVRGAILLERMEPDNVVQLADGRVGGPVTTYVPVGQGGAPDAYAVINVNIFTQESARNNQWVLDQTMTLCLGDCEPYYGSLGANSTPAATPEATNDAFWLQPLTAADCTVQPLPLEDAQAIRNQTPTTSEPTYLPVVSADEVTAGDIAAEGRSWLACLNDGPSRTHEALETDEFINATQYGFVWLSNPEWYTANIDEVRDLSEQIIDPDPSTYWIGANPAQLANAEDSLDFTDTMLPEHAVTLADGRVGLPVFLLDPLGGETTVNFNEPFQLIRFVILVPNPDQPGTWLVDETLPLCSGDCNALWSDPATVLKQYGLISRESFLTATPVAVQVDSWRQPLTAADCTVQPLTREEIAAIQNNPPVFTERVYLPIMEPDPGLVPEIVDAVRIAAACRVTGELGQYEAVQSPTYLYSQQSQGYINIRGSQEYVQAASEEFARQLLDSDWTTYVVERDNPPPDNGRAINTIAQPQHVYQLPDDRIGAVLSRIVPPGTIASNPNVSAAQPVVFQIYLHDSDTGHWLLDEELLLPLPTAEPTPADPLALLPTAANCTVQGLTQEQINTLQQTTPVTNQNRTYRNPLFVPADIAIKVTSTAQQWTACGEWGTPSQRIALETHRRIQGDLPSDAESTASDQLIARLVGDDWHPWFIEDNTINYTPSPINQRYLVLVPENTWILPDGRVVGIYSQVASSEYIAGLANRDGVNVRVVVFQQDYNNITGFQWRVDEDLWHCFGTCDAIATPSMTPSEVLPAPTADTTCVNGTIIQPAEITPPPVAGEDCRGDDPTDGGDNVRIEPLPDSPTPPG